MPQIPDRHSQVVFDHPALQVAAASATHMLAMKARAARAQDIADVTSLLRRCGLTTPDEVDKLTQGVFGEPLGPRQRRWIEDLIDHITHSPAPDTPQTTPLPKPDPGSNSPRCVPPTPPMPTITVALRGNRRGNCVSWEPSPLRCF